MRKEHEKKHLNDCILNSSHFFEDVVLRKSKKLSPLLLTLLCLASPLAADYYTVTDLGDAPDGGINTLRNAILAANSNPRPSIILLPNNSHITLEDHLPKITASDITFMGMGSMPTVLDGQGKFAAIVADSSAPSSQKIAFQNIIFSLHASNADITTTTHLTGAGGTLHLSGNKTVSVHSSGGNTYGGTTHATAQTLQSSGLNPFGTSTLNVDNTPTWNLTAANTITSPINFNTTTNLKAQSGTSSFLGQIGGSGTVNYTSTGQASLHIVPEKDNSSFTGVIQNNGSSLSVGGANPLGGKEATYHLAGPSPSTIFTKSGSYPNAILLEENSSPTFTASADTCNLISGVMSNEGRSVGPVVFNGSGAITLTGVNAFVSEKVLFDTGLSVEASGPSPFGDKSNPVSLKENTLTFIDNSTIENKLTFVNSPTLIANSNTRTTLAGPLSGSDYAVGLQTGSQNGVLTLAGDNAHYQNTLTINQGTVQAPTPTHLGKGSIVLNGPTSCLELMEGSNTYTNSIKVNGGSMKVPASEHTTWTGPLIGSGSLAIGGDGTITLSGNNQDYSGDLYLHKSTLELASAKNLGTGTVHLVNNATLRPTSTNETYSNPLAITGAEGMIALGTTTQTWSGPLSGNSSLMLLDSGTLNVSGDNSSFGGGFKVGQATLEAASSNHLGHGSIHINGGQFVFNGQNQFLSNDIVLDTRGGVITTNGANNTFSGKISGNGPLTLSGTQGVSLSGANTYTGNTFLSTAAVGISGSSPFGTGEVTSAGTQLTAIGNVTLQNTIHFTENSTLTVHPEFTAILHGKLLGTKSLTKQGQGILAIQGNNPDFTGNVNLNEGLVQLKGINPLGTQAIALTGSPVEFVGHTTLTNSDLVLHTTSHITTAPKVVATLNSPISAIGNAGLTLGGKGTVILAGHNTHAGTTTVASGTTHITGTLSNSATIVEPSGVLSGTGSIQALDLYGTLSLVSGQGLTAANTTFDSSSTFKVRLSGSSGPALHSTGTVKINPGATLDLSYNPYLAGSYHVIHADRLLKGQFANLPSGSARYPVSFGLNRNNFFINIAEIPFANLVTEGNPHNIAYCFDSFAQDPSPSLIPVLNVFNGLSQAELVSAFDQLDPAIYNVLSYAEEALGERLIQVYTQHGIDRQFAPTLCRGIWAAYYGEQQIQHRLKGSRAYGGYRDTFNGVAVGCDQLFCNVLVTGGFSYANSQIHWTDVKKAHASIDSYTGFTGGTWYTNPFMINAFASFTRNVVSGNRSLLIGPSSPTPITDEIQYDVNSNLYTAHLGMISKRDLNRCTFGLTYGNLDYFFVTRDCINERGGGALDIVVHSRNSDLLRPEVGFGMGVYGDLNACSKVVGDIRVGFAKEIRFIGHSGVANFKDNWCSFTVGGLFPRQNLVTVSANLLFTNISGLDVAFDYQGYYGTHTSNNSGKAEISYVF